jgi:transcriptional regulator with XRE-family HTH domain
MRDTMQTMPMLKPMRTLRSLSQRALAKKSGVAHDTIGQIERGERLTRPETVRKLGAALDVKPYILTFTHEDTRRGT